jgi:hypothetical protein
VIRSAPSPAQIGDRLRVARLDRRLSLEESAWRTRIRPDLLRALEEDRYDELGHESFAKSHLTSYARFLGIDPSEVVRAFDASRDHPAPSSLEELNRAARSARKPPRARWLLASLVSLVVLIAGATVGILGGQAERPSAEVAVVMAQEPALPLRVALRIEALQDIHVSVQADGAEVFEGVLRAGQARTFRARETLDVVAADGGAISLEVNGRALGVPGESGTIFRGRFGPDGPADPEE